MAKADPIEPDVVDADEAVVEAPVAVPMIDSPAAPVHELHGLADY